ncbi:MAG: beta-propeller fold lactonase family protein [Deltaproteobacteria bacterium]|nr:beta-propeller fold lactonase family protein [Deltaproteobacteria bacterium]
MPRADSQRQMERVKQARFDRNPLPTALGRGLSPSLILSLVLLGSCIHPPSKTIAKAAPNTLHVFAYALGAGDIALLSFDPSTGHLSLEKSFSQSGNYGAISSDGRHMYVCDGKGEHGVIHAFSRDTHDGTLKWLASTNSGGSAPTHLSVDPAGHFVLVANFRSDDVHVFQMQPDGRLGASVASLPTGHRPHQIAFSHDGRFVFVPNRDDDSVGRYRFDKRSGSLQELPAADGNQTRLRTHPRPRHIAIHPSNRAAYLVHEGEMTLVSYDLDPDTGNLTNPAAATTRQGGGAHVIVSPDGRFVYVSVRSPPASIYTYEVDPASFRPRQLQRFVHPSITGPRDFAIDATGTFLLVGSQEQHTVVTLQLNTANGTVSNVKQAVRINSNAAFVGFARETHGMQRQD